MDCPDHLGKSVSRRRPLRFLCIGGATVDRYYHLPAPAVIGCSNPARGIKSFGGVARNVAEVLVRLGAEARLASVVGEDRPGDDLDAAMRSCGVDTSLVSRRRGARTAEYIAAFHEGELFSAFADMEVLDTIDPPFIDNVLKSKEHIDGLFADCNLPVPVLVRLREHCGEKRLALAVNTVSTAKSKRLGGSLAGVDLLVTNHAEAQAIVGESEPETTVKEFLKLGAAAVVLSQGASGVQAGENGRLMRILMPGTTIRNVSGAGDALAAGTFLRRLEGAGLYDAVMFGMGCALAALKWPTARPQGFDRLEAERCMELIAASNPC